MNQGLEIMFIGIGFLLFLAILYSLWPYLVGLLAIIGAFQVIQALSKARLRKQRNRYYHANRK